MDGLVTRFLALRQCIEDDYNVYVTNLPLMKNALDEIFISDLSSIIHQYLQPNREGKGIFDLRVKENSIIMYNGWDLWVVVADLPTCESHLECNFAFYDPEWVLEDMEEAYKQEKTRED